MQVLLGDVVKIASTWSGKGFRKGRIANSAENRVVILRSADSENSRSLGGAAVRGDVLGVKGVDEVGEVAVRAGRVDWCGQRADEYAHCPPEVAGAPVTESPPSRSGLGGHRTLERTTPCRPSQPSLPDHRAHAGVHYSM